MTTVSLQGFVRNIDWNLLRTFHVIAETSSISRAAEVLGRQQPAVSLSLKRLEGHLGVTLCRRTPMMFQLTPEGMRIAETCRTIFEHVGDMTGSIANIEKEIVGRLRIAAVSSLRSERLENAIAKFHRNCPNVAIEVDVMPWEEVHRQLTRRQADVGFGPSRFFQADFDYSVLYQETINLYCGRANPLFGAQDVSPRELSGEGLILTGGDEPDVITRFRLQHGLGNKSAGRCEQLDEAMRLTRLGVGICFLPEELAQPLVEAGSLWSMLSEEDRFTCEIYTVVPQANPPELPTRLFLETLQAVELSSTA